MSPNNVIVGPFSACLTDENECLHRKQTADWNASSVYKDPQPKANVTLSGSAREQQLTAAPKPCILHPDHVAAQRL